MSMILTLLQPILDQAITLAGAALLATGTWAAKRAADWLRLSADAKVRAYLLDCVERAVALAEAEARRLLPDATPQSATVTRAQRYVEERVPGALRHFGITPAGLRDIIQARLGGA